MKRILSRVLAGCLAVCSLCAQSFVIWDGLLEPASTPLAALDLGTSSAVGLQITPDAPVRLDSLEGFIGRPAEPVIVSPHLPVPPSVTVALWSEGTLLDTQDVTLVASPVRPFVTPSALPVWRVGWIAGLLDDDLWLSSDPWVLQPGHTYIIALSFRSPVEWLVHNPVLDASLMHGGTGWESLPGVLGWNARLSVVPVPEPHWVGAAALALVVFALGRRIGSTR